MPFQCKASHTSEIIRLFLKMLPKNHIGSLEMLIKGHTPHGIQAFGWLADKKDRNGVADRLE